jgi:hypothetical protein
MAKVFKMRKAQAENGYDIRTIMGHNVTEGDVGLEIECEGNKFLKEGVQLPWKYVKDGSLRGQDNAEYILKVPIKFDKVPEAIDSLWKMFERHGSVLSESNRTSVHVHLNAQGFHMNRVCAFVSIYFIVEDLLTQWCGDHRVGNLFCLRAKDAPGIVSKIKQFLLYEGRGGGLSEGLHYGGLNAHALAKFGSIEIRALRGVTDPKIIIDWVSILERIYKVSEEFPDPRGICDNFSGAGPIDFLHMLLGDKTQMVLDGIPYDNGQVMESLYEGIRIAQDLCYCRDWSVYQPIVTKIDPFGRTTKKIKATSFATNFGGISAGSTQTATPYPQVTPVSLSEYLATMPPPHPSPVPPSTMQGFTIDLESEEDEDENDYDYQDENDYDEEEGYNG